MVRWNSYVTFREAACDVLQAAYDSGVNTNVVKTCFALRGLPLDDCPLDDALHKLCAGKTKREDGKQGEGALLKIGERERVGGWVGERKNC